MITSIISTTNREKHESVNQDQTSKRSENFVNFIEKKIGKQKKHALYLTRLSTCIGRHAARLQLNQKKVNKHIKYYVFSKNI